MRSRFRRGRRAHGAEAAPAAEDESGSAPGADAFPEAAEPEIADVLEAEIETVEDSPAVAGPAPPPGQIIEIPSRFKGAPSSSPDRIDIVPGPESEAIEDVAEIAPPRSPAIDWTALRERARTVGKGAVAWGAQAQKSLSRLGRATGALLTPSRQEDVLRTTEDAARNRTLFNRLSSAAILSDAEGRAVDAASSSVRKTHQAGAEIALEGEVTPKPAFIVSGWAYRRRMLGNGRSVFVGFLVPGDGIGLRGCAEPLGSCTIEALTTVETVDASRLIRLAEDPQHYGGIAHALQRSTVLEEEFLTNHILRLGGLSPEARLAHLMMELHFRMQAAGLATGDEFHMPLTRETLSEALGTGVRATARLLRRFRHAGLIKWRYGRARMISLKELRKLSQFRAPSTCTCGRMRMIPAHAC